MDTFFSFPQYNTSYSTSSAIGVSLNANNGKKINGNKSRPTANSLLPFPYLAAISLLLQF